MNKYDIVSSRHVENEILICEGPYREQGIFYCRQNVGIIH